MGLFSFLPYINVFSRVLFFCILCVYLISLIYKFFVPVIRRGFADELCLQQQFREDYETCVLEKKKLENDLELQRDMIKKMNKKLREWHEKRVICCQREAKERQMNLKKWKMRQEEIVTIEKERCRQQEMGRMLLAQAKVTLRKKLHGEVGEKNVQAIINRTLQKETLKFGDDG